MTERIIEGRWSAEKCPRCGATLLTNDQGDLWCSFIGGAGRVACAFGLAAEDGPEVAETVPGHTERLIALLREALQLDRHPEASAQPRTLAEAADLRARAHALIAEVTT